MSNRGWIDVNKKLPPCEETVWLYNATQNWAGLGSRVYLTNDGWYWVVLSYHDLVYADGDRIVFDGELDDEYEVTHWHPVPRLPKLEGRSRDEQN